MTNEPSAPEKCLRALCKECEEGSDRIDMGGNCDTCEIGLVLKEKGGKK